MYLNRHCTYQDYELLKSSTDEVVFDLSNNDFSSLDKYFELLNNFDIHFSIELKNKIDSCSNDKDKIIEIISKDIEELYRNVLVDIKEHN